MRIWRVVVVIVVVIMMVVMIVPVMMMMVVILGHQPTHARSKRVAMGAISHV